MIMLSLFYNLIIIIMKIKLIKIMKFLLEIAEHKMFPPFSIMLKLNRMAFNFDAYALNILSFFPCHLTNDNPINFVIG